MLKEKSQRKAIAPKGLARHILLAKRDEKLLNLALRYRIRRKPRLLEKGIDAPKVALLRTHRQTRKLHIRHKFRFPDVGGKFVTPYVEFLFIPNQMISQNHIGSRIVRLCIVEYIEQR